MHMLRAPRMWLGALALAAGLVALLPRPCYAAAVAPTDDHLQLLGRWDTHDPQAITAAWSAATIRFRLAGTTCTARLSTSNTDYLQIVVDGAPTQKVKLSKEADATVTVGPLPAGTHTVELMKATEPYQGSITFKGLELPAGATLADLPPVTRRIEFIGDSITAGYGNEDTDKTHHFKPETENAALTYGVLTARALHADWNVVAVSGICIVDFGKHDAMPQRYPNVALWSPTPWDFSRQVPDAVVVNLGTNDSGHKDMKPEAYTQAWRDFIKTLRGHYSQAHIFCTVAPMGSHPALEACIKTAVEEANAAGDAKVHAIHLPEQDEKLDGIGADWHPTVKCHERLAGVLAPLIGKALGW